MEGAQGEAPGRPRGKLQVQNDVVGGRQGEHPTQGFIALGDHKTFPAAAVDHPEQCNSPAARITKKFNWIGKPQKKRLSVERQPSDALRQTAIQTTWHSDLERFTIC